MQLEAIDVDVDVDVIVDVVVDCRLYACAREPGRLPLWIEFLALSPALVEPSRGVTRFSLSN